MQENLQSRRGGSLTLAPLMRLRLALAALLAVVLPFALWSALPVGSSAQSQGEIQRKIHRNQAMIGGHKAHERVLTTDISQQSKRINSLQSDITRLSVKQQTLQASLDKKRAQLAAVQADLRAEQARLTRLRAGLLVVRKQLATRLVDLYKGDRPDLVTVVLEANGFEDLLTRTEFMSRISHQDARIMGIVAAAKADAKTTAAKLDKLEKAQAKVAQQVESERDQVSTIRVGLVDRRNRIQTARATKVELLRSSRDRRHELEDDVEKLRAQSAKIQARLSSYSGPVSAGRIKAGSGGLIWPVNGPITSPFCESRAWESCHPGIDIGVPAGTPI